MLNKLFHRRKPGKGKEKALTTALRHAESTSSLPSHVSEPAKSITVQNLAVPPDPTSVEHLSGQGGPFLRQQAPPPIVNTVPPDPTDVPPSAPHAVSSSTDRRKLTTRSPAPTSAERPSVSGELPLPQPSPLPIINSTPVDPTHRSASASPTPAAPVSYFEGSVNPVIHNPTFNNIAGDATILKFDGGERARC